MIEIGTGQQDGYRCFIAEKPQGYYNPCADATTISDPNGILPAICTSIKEIVLGWQTVSKLYS